MWGHSQVLTRHAHYMSSVSELLGMLHDRHGKVMLTAADTIAAEDAMRPHKPPTHQRLQQIELIRVMSKCVKLDLRLWVTGRCLQRKPQPNNPGSPSVCVKRNPMCAANLGHICPHFMLT